VREVHAGPSASGRAGIDHRVLPGKHAGRVCSRAMAAAPITLLFSDLVKLHRVAPARGRRAGPTHPPRTPSAAIGGQPARLDGLPPPAGGAACRGRRRRAREQPRRAERARCEIDVLTRELAAAVGLAGCDRRAASDAERARLA